MSAKYPNLTPIYKFNFDATELAFGFPFQVSGFKHILQSIAAAV
jgi:hypothetical protein